MDRRQFPLPALCLLILTIVGLTQNPARAQAPCPADHEKLLAALKANVKASGGPANGGFETNEWAAVVARDGTVCAVAFSGPAVDAQWPGSRLIAAEKANTANGLSLANMALSTANLYAGVQPGGPLFGLQATNPVNQVAAYAGDAKTFGSAQDPLLGKPIGGIVVFGGGLALYDGKTIVGALGVSGDSSCADHNVAWRVRAALGLDKVPAGVNPNRKDAIIYDLDPGGKSASGWGHPLCAGHEADVAAELGSGVGGSTPK
ncbi:heme-binding protein [Mesorhizobium sp. WSM3626]|uniref:heme-binding protein n=1 Tax=Mesorhizobium sp. WSM3626 TaxID=1040987 RepID=UPI000480BF4A|nr:heme-binding protein [Mesorhizobium sp. WSM3626]